MGRTRDDHKVLRAIVEAAESGKELVNADDLIDRTGLGYESVQRALRTLSASRDLFFKVNLGAGGDVVAVHSVTALARLVAAGLPTTPEKPDRRAQGLLRTVGTAVGGFALTLTAKVLANMITEQTHR
ncbi:hypothetical protein [Micromonospora peucetia]|uniref:hypothetical protein n=1 Tax=Micromonospora peucetia TaxID=47871 RepID=UPI00114CCE49|nr:hypothetical protein [Micromonospora peucetia]